MIFERSYRRKQPPLYKCFPVRRTFSFYIIEALCLPTFIDTQLPAQVDYFHSLVPLDLSHQKNATIFGFPSWVYKAQSSKDGNFYALRRLEGVYHLYKLFRVLFH